MYKFAKINLDNYNILARKKDIENFYSNKGVYN